MSRANSHQAPIDQGTDDAISSEKRWVYRFVLLKRDSTREVRKRRTEIKPVRRTFLFLDGRTERMVSGRGCRWGLRQRVSVTNCSNLVSVKVKAEVQQ